MTSDASSYPVSCKFYTYVFWVRVQAHIAIKGTSTLKITDNTFIMHHLNPHQKALFSTISLGVYKTTMFIAYWLQVKATNDSHVVLTPTITEKVASVQYDTTYLLTAVG